MKLLVLRCVQAKDAKQNDEVKALIALCRIAELLPPMLPLRSAALCNAPRASPVARGHACRRRISKLEWHCG